MHGLPIQLLLAVCRVLLFIVAHNQANANGNIPLGKITSANGAAKTGGGTSGGTTPGGGGGRGYVQ